MRWKVGLAIASAMVVFPVLPTARATEAAPVRGADAAKRERFRQGALGLSICPSDRDAAAGAAELRAYLDRNRIRFVHLDPGASVTGEEGKKTLDRLRLVRAGLGKLPARVSLVIADRKTNLADAASALAAEPGLGIEWISDDSGFEGVNVTELKRRQEEVQSRRLHYSAFLTVEVAGNSGVSDEVRNWAVENLEETVLQSHLSCDAAEQMRWVEPYLIAADAAKRRDSVRIGILTGPARSGREVSCGRALDEAAFRALVKEIHLRAKKYRSYAGIVLEEGRSIPVHDVGTGAW